MTSSGREYRTVVFLDTNVLHFMRLCLDRLGDTDVGGAATAESEGCAVALRERCVEMDDPKLEQSIRQGLETILALARSEVLVEYARVSEIELLTGLARGEAIVRAAKEGVPYRMWSRLSDGEIQERLSAASTECIRRRVEGLQGRLEDCGIDVSLSDGRRTNEVVHLAKRILGLVYMSDMDSIVYASSIVTRADFLCTADGPLRSIVNKIRGDQEGRFCDVRLSLEEFVEDGESESDADWQGLPRAFVFGADGRVKGVSRFP